MMWRINWAPEIYTITFIFNTMKQFEYVLIQIIWNAALNASLELDWQNDFHKSFEELNQHILDTYLT